MIENTLWFCPSTTKMGYTRSDFRGRLLAHDRETGCTYAEWHSLDLI